MNSAVVFVMVSRSLVVTLNNLGEFFSILDFLPCIASFFLSKYAVDAVDQTAEVVRRIITY